MIDDFLAWLRQPETLEASELNEENHLEPPQAVPRYIVPRGTGLVGSADYHHSSLAEKFQRATAAPISGAEAIQSELAVIMAAPNLELARAANLLMQIERIVALRLYQDSISP